MDKRIFDTLRAPGWRRAAIALAFVGLVVAGCAQRDRAEDDNRPGEFYGGVSGGLTR